MDEYATCGLWNAWARLLIWLKAWWDKVVPDLSALVEALECLEELNVWRWSQTKSFGELFSDERATAFILKQQRKMAKQIVPRYATYLVWEKTHDTEIIRGLTAYHQGLWKQPDCSGFFRNFDMRKDSFKTISTSYSFCYSRLFSERILNFQREIRHF